MKERHQLHEDIINYIIDYIIYTMFYLSKENKCVTF